MSKKYVSGKNKCCLYCYNHWTLSPPHAWCICFGKCSFMLNDWHWRLTPSQPHQKLPCPLEETSALRNQTQRLLREAVSPALTNKLPDWQGRGDLKDASTAGLRSFHVNIVCLLGEQGWSSFLYRGNCVCFVTVVREENATICFDSSPHVPVKCECACLIASCAKHSAECVVFQ